MVILNLLLQFHTVKTELNYYQDQLIKLLEYGIFKRLNKFNYLSDIKIKLLKYNLILRKIKLYLPH